MKVMRKSPFMRRAVPIFIGVSLFLTPYQVFPSEADLGSESELSWVMKKIKERERGLKTFTARFVQTKKTYLLKEPLRSEGVVYFDRTGKILLRVMSPSPLIVLLKDNMLLIYYPDLSKTEERYLGRTDDILKKYFGIGQSIGEVRKQYAIGLVSKTHSDAYRLRLIPKMEAITKYIETIEVLVSARNWLPERIHFREVEGDNTTLTLQFTSINEPLPPGIFTIDIPRDDGDDI